MSDDVPFRQYLGWLKETVKMNKTRNSILTSFKFSGPFIIEEGQLRSFKHVMKMGVDKMVRKISQASRREKKPSIFKDRKMIKMKTIKSTIVSYHHYIIRKIFKEREKGKED